MTRDEVVNAAWSLLEIYDRVHDELDAGMPWEEIDNGLDKEWSYDYWHGYMQQRMINELRQLVYQSAEGDDDA